MPLPPDITATVNMRSARDTILRTQLCICIFTVNFTIKLCWHPGTKKELPKSKYLQVFESFTELCRHHCLILMHEDCKGIKKNREWTPSSNEVVQLRGAIQSQSIGKKGGVSNLLHGFTPCPPLKESSIKVPICTRKQWGRRDNLSRHR